MDRHWTFGRKIGAGFAVTVALAVATGMVAIYALNSVVESKDRVISAHAEVLIDAERLELASERKVTTARGFLLTRDERFLDRLREASGDFTTVAEHLKSTVDTDEERATIGALVRADTENQVIVEQILALRRTDAPLDSVVRVFSEQLMPRRDAMRQDIEAFVEHQERLLDGGRRASTDAAALAVRLVAAISAVLVLFAAAVAYVLTRALARQIGAAVGQVQSSSTELQASANQQATGAREQATAMNEITVTISELLATSRQIAESARQVAQIAEETATAARAGDGTVERAHESIATIRRQVDLVVGHMLDLGKKSQQIGSVLDIVSELAEQTNILAINATIEAAGAGEAGKRFGVVADEIRKLADRVAASTKEIRVLIEDVRSAVNTTVMATESGSKAVDSGSKQFGDVASAFKRIAGLVSTTTQAAREIELSTKQQATAVEQVNVATSNVAQATNETEASTGQTLQTASLLAHLSRDLMRLIRPQESA